jgi:hypothetical protein
VPREVLRELGQEAHDHLERTIASLLKKAPRPRATTLAQILEM